MSNWKEFLTRKNMLALLGLLLIAVALPIAAVLVGQRQETRKRAAECPLGAASRSSVRFVNLSGQPITAAALDDNVRLEVNVGAVDAADIVLGFNTDKLVLDETFAANGIAKTSAGGLAHFGNSGAVDDAPGRTDVDRILFMVQRPRGATATGGKIATVDFKVIAARATTTSIIYGERTTLALNGEGGHLECGNATLATLALNGAPTNTPPVGGPTNTPVPAGGVGFSLRPASGQVSNPFNLAVNLNPGSASTNNFKVAYKFDGDKLSCASEATDGVHTTCNALLGTDSYVVFDTAGSATINTATDIGIITFTFKGSNKSANVTYDRAANDDGTLKYVYALNAAGQRMTVSVADTCYLTADGACAAVPTNTPGPTATPGSAPVNAVNAPANTNVANITVSFSASPAPVPVPAGGDAAAVGQVVRVLSQPDDGVAPVAADWYPAHCNGNNIPPTAATAAAGKWLYCGTTLNSVSWTFASPGSKKIYAIFRNDVNNTATAYWGAAANQWSAPVSAAVAYAGPTNTPIPTLPPFPTTTPNPLSDNALYISDDLPATLTPGQTFTAHVTMKNTGTSTWRATERFHGLSASPQCSGAACRWGSSGVLVTANVAPQSEHTFTLNLTAPVTSGTYDSFWQMVQSNQLFGQQGGKRIVVAVIPTATPTVPACLRGALGNLDCSADGRIDTSDLTILLSSWGSPVPTPAAGRRSADLAGNDGRVDTSDLTVLLGNWGTGN